MEIADARSLKKHQIVNHAEAKSKLLIFLIWLLRSTELVQLLYVSPAPFLV